jgi:hypothetical protein
LWQPGLHGAAEAPQSGDAIRKNVDHVLVLRMVEQEAVDRPVVAVGEIGLEAVDVKPPRALLASEGTAEEPYFAIFGKEVDDLTVEALVDQVAVKVMKLPHRLLILLNLEAAGEIGNGGLERGNTILVGHQACSSHKLAT